MGEADYAARGGGGDRDRDRDRVRRMLAMLAVGALAMVALLFGGMAAITAAIVRDYSEVRAGRCCARASRVASAGGALSPAHSLARAHDH